MHRCFIEPTEWKNNRLRLSAEEDHHLLNVLRVRNGDIVTVFDGRGKEAPARVLIRPRGDVERKETRGAGHQKGGCVLLDVIGEPRVMPAASPRLTLAQSLPKAGKMDFIIEKAVELGASSVIPVITERVVARPDAQREKDRLERWRRIAVSAARQCGVNWVPEISPVAGFEDIAGRLRDYDLFLLGSLAPSARGLRQALREARLKNPAEICILIGPEGDFTPDETESAMNAGAMPVSFGPLTLRVDTAALYALSVLVYEFRGDYAG